MGVLSELFSSQQRRSSARSPAAAPPVPTQAFGEEEYADRDDYEVLPVLTLRHWDYGHGLDKDNAGYGFTTPDGRIWAAHHCLWSTWDELGVLMIHAVGVSYHLDGLNDPSFDPGRPVRLFPEPDNPVDPKAIAIRNWTADKTAGYVKKDNTSRLRNLLRGEDLRVMALSCSYDAPPPRGRRQSLRIVIFRPDRLIGAEHVPPHPGLDEPTR